MKKPIKLIGKQKNKAYSCHIENEYSPIENVKNIIGIELLSAAQAMDFRRPLQSSEVNETLLRSYRKIVPFIENDRILANDILKSKTFLFQ